MKNDLSQPERSHRDRVTLVLAFLSSEKCRNACYQILEPERLAYEWCRLWFNEVYVPSLRYLSGLKGDRSQEAVHRFQACFAEEEQEELERFHRFLELRVDMLSEDAHQRETFPQNDAWDSIVRHAGYVLEELETIDPDDVRDRMSIVVRLLIRHSEQTQEAADRALLTSLTEALAHPQLPD